MIVTGMYLRKFVAAAQIKRLILILNSSNIRLQACYCPWHRQRNLCKRLVTQYIFFYLRKEVQMFPERRIGRQVSFPQNMKGQKTRAIVDMMASAQLSKHNQGYTSSNSDGVALEDWFSGSDVQILFDPMTSQTASSLEDGTSHQTLTLYLQNSVANNLTVPS